MLSKSPNISALCPQRRPSTLLNTASSALTIGASPSVSTALLTEQIGVCRICLEEVDNRTLLRPCQCKGTQAFVHSICLNMWIKTSQQMVGFNCLKIFNFFLIFRHAKHAKRNMKWSSRRLNPSRNGVGQKHSAINGKMKRTFFAFSFGELFSFESRTFVQGIC